MPKVSVIVPNYNHSPYLHERINSILAQTFTDIELILMDDKSTDNSRRILEEYRSLPHVKIVFNEENSGSSFKQWNKGVKLASGEYIWIAESDDAAAPEFLSTLVKVLDTNPGVALAYTQSYETNSEGYITGTWFDHTKMLDAARWTTDFVMEGNEMIMKYMIHHNCIPNASAVVFRKNKMEAIGMADETFKLNGDWLFWIKLMENSKVAFVAKSFNYFRKHKNSVRSLTIYTGIGLYEYSRIVDYVSKHLNYNNGQKRDVIAEFYAKLKWLPPFYSFKMEPVAFRNVRKAYANLIKLHSIALFFFMKHIARRFVLYNMRAVLSTIRKRSSAK
jgi:glycosyltransferase involved in cell wall biosynthesis